MSEAILVTFEERLVAFCDERRHCESSVPMRWSREKAEIAIIQSASAENFNSPERPSSLSACSDAVAGRFVAICSSIALANLAETLVP